MRQSPTTEGSAGVGGNPTPATPVNRVTLTTQTAVRPSGSGPIIFTDDDDDLFSTLVAKGRDHSFPTLFEIVANGSGKTASTSGNPIVANVPLPSNLDEFGTDNNAEIVVVTQGWRLEINSNGHHRWRWQIKNDAGKPVTYKTKAGRTAYKRGSKYVSKQAAEKIINAG